MNKEAQSIALEIETLFTLFEEKKVYQNKKRLQQLLKEDRNVSISELSLTECHVIACITTMKNPNGISIAAELKMTRGGISKIAARLLQKNLITTYKDEKNQKIIYYKLTPLGEKVNQIHEKLHKENHDSIEAIANSYSIEEQRIILKFIKDLQNLQTNHFSRSED